MTHTGDKPFSCMECDKNLLRVCGLEWHANAHTGDRHASPCSQAVSQLFEDDDCAGRHQIVHTGENLTIDEDL